MCRGALSSDDAAAATGPMSGVATVATSRAVTRRRARWRWTSRVNGARDLDVVVGQRSDSLAEDAGRELEPQQPHDGGEDADDGVVGEWCRPGDAAGRPGVADESEERPGRPDKQGEQGECRSDGSDQAHGLGSCRGFAVSVVRIRAIGCGQGWRGGVDDGWGHVSSWSIERAVAVAATSSELMPTAESRVVSCWVVTVTVTSRPWTVTVPWAPTADR